MAPTASWCHEACGHPSSSQPQPISLCSSPGPLLSPGCSKGQRLPSCTHTSLGSTGSRQLRPRSSLQELLGTPWGCSPAFCSKKPVLEPAAAAPVTPPPPVES